MTRRSEVQSRLSTLEREVSQLREENSTKDAENAMLKAALQREHEGYMRLQSKQNQELDTLRQEYERQLSQLTEQIAVLRHVSDSASSEQQRTAEDANHRKAQFMQLLEKERDEKNRVLAEYRFQTEALIAEQGREIQGLRALLESSRTEEERLVNGISGLEEQRRDLEEQVMRLHNQSTEEKANQQRALRETDAKMTREVANLNLKLERAEAETRSIQQRAKHDQQAADDRCRQLEQKVVEQERSAVAERSAMKEQFEAMMQKLMAESSQMREAKETAERRMRDELERTAKQQVETIQALRADIEKSRTEKQVQFDEFRKHKETLTSDFQRKVSELETLLDRARGDAEHAKNQSRESDAKLHAAQLRNETLQSALTKVSNESEQQTIEHRQKEREMAQTYSKKEDEVKSQLLQTDAQVNQLKQQIARADVELSNQKEAVASQKREFDGREAEMKSQLQHLRTTNESLALVRDDFQHKLQQAQTQLANEKSILEAEVTRLQRACDEREAKLQASSRQLIDERNALELALSEAKKLRVAVSDARVGAETDRKLLQQFQLTEAEHRNALADRAVKMEELHQAVSEASRTIGQLRDEITTIKRTHEAFIGDVNRSWQTKLSAAEAERDARVNIERQLHEARADLNAHVQQAREEESRWQRENLARDEAHYAAMVACRREAEDECDRLEAIIEALRNELARSQQGKLSAARENSENVTEVERKASLLQESLDQERTTKARVMEELRAKEHLVAELQGTTRVLTNRLTFRDEEQRRLEIDLDEASKKMMEAHAALGKRDATIGQLSARIRVLEARSNHGNNSAGGHQNNSSSFLIQQQYRDPSSQHSAAGDSPSRKL